MKETNNPDLLRTRNVNGNGAKGGMVEPSHGIKKKPIIIETLSEKRKCSGNLRGRKMLEETLASSEKWPSHPNP